MSNINDKIRQIAKETEPELIRIRRELHQYPELGIDLPKTHEIISRELHKIPGLKIREHVAGGYGRDPQLLAEDLCLGAFARTGCTQQDQFHTHNCDISQTYSRKPL